MIHKIKTIILADFFIKKIIAYSFLVIILFIAKDFFMIFLITFLFAYLIFSLSKYLSNKIQNKFSNIRNKSIIKKMFGINAIVSYIYILIIIGAIIFISHIVPILKTELNNFSNHMPLVADYTKKIANNLSYLQNTKELVSSDLEKLINEKNIGILLDTIEHIKKIGGGVVSFFISFILSFFFIIDRKKLLKYLEGIKKSSVKFLYEEYSFLFSKIAKGFLLVFKAQFKIALANTIFTYLGLLFISFIIGQHIPYIGILIIIVFILSFIPILGAFISSIPIILILYNLAGIKGVIYVIIMISFIHMVEAYLLNPRFVSEAVELPVSLTFLILIVGEHLFGPIGLIVSVPLFYIIVEILSDLDKNFKQKLSK